MGLTPPKSSGGKLFGHQGEKAPRCHSCLGERRKPGNGQVFNSVPSPLPAPFHFLGMPSWPFLGFTGQDEWFGVGFPEPSGPRPEDP